MTAKDKGDRMNLSPFHGSSKAQKAVIWPCALHSSTPHKIASKKGLPQTFSNDQIHTQAKERSPNRSIENLQSQNCFSYI